MFTRFLPLFLTAMVSGALPLGAQELALCEPVRVSFCEDGDCRASTLTATARLWHVDHDRLLLDPAGRLRVSVRTDSMSRQYNVIGLRESAIGIPGPGGVSWVRLATGWSREESQLAVPMRSVDRLQVQAPRGRWAGAGRGALLGAGVGLGVGLYAAAQPCDELACIGNAIGFWGSLILGPTLGGAVGAIFPGMRWSPGLVGSDGHSALLTGPPSLAEAPSPDRSPGMGPGRCDRVRVTYCQGGCDTPLEATGRYLDADSESLRVLQPDRLEIPRDAITRLNVTVPRTRLEGARHGAIWGAVAGAVVGVGITGYTYVQCAGVTRGCPPLVRITPISALVGGLFGGAAGRIAPGERWTVATTAITGGQ